MNTVDVDEMERLTRVLVDTAMRWCA
jgi:hypothetical protein